MTPFDRALDATAELPAEDVILLMRALLNRFDEGDWPALFDGRAVEEVERLILYLWLRLDSEDRVGMLGALVGRGVEEYVPPAEMLKWARWVEACLGKDHA